jgi:DNA-binding LytR/AlgR family response regulator
MMTRLVLPEPPQIGYLKSEINYTVFHLADGKEMLVSYTLKKFQNQVGFANFLRVNKSFLLNPAYIVKYVRDGKKFMIILQNGNRIQVSRRKLGLVRERISA